MPLHRLECVSRSVIAVTRGTAQKEGPTIAFQFEPIGCGGISNLAQLGSKPGTSPRRDLPSFRVTVPKAAQNSARCTH